jgi:NADPH-dependent curcumin reductase CurA
MMFSAGSNKPGVPMTGFVSGKVIRSRNVGWSEGDLIGGSFPFSTVQVITTEQLEKTIVFKLTDFITEEQLSWGIGVMGMPGSTAYGGVLDVLRPQKGETIFVSAAAGVVGSLVGMLAKNLYGCKVIGSCGGPEKCAIITSEYGFDAAIDYKLCPDEESLTAKLKEAAPDGIDMYFENVGGVHFQAAKTCLRIGGR